MLGHGIAEVASFLDIAFDDTPKLAPDALAERLLTYLDAAGRYVRQLPADKAEVRLARRDWPHWKLVHHAFHITDIFLEQRAGARIVKASFEVDVPKAERGFDVLADYGAAQRARFADWWAREGSASDLTAPTSFEDRTLTVHQVLERTTWHTCQHVRQMADVLESEGIAPDGRLERQDWAGLPVPESIWSD